MRIEGDEGRVVLFSKARGFMRLWRPGSSRHWAQALGGSGSAHRAGRFRGSYIVSLRREAVFPKARGFRRLWRPGSSRHWAQALGGSGSARRAGRFRGSYECCLRQRPMSESEHNPSTQPAAPAAPLCALWAPPLNPLNLLNRLNPHAAGVSGASRVSCPFALSFIPPVIRCQFFI